MSDHAASTIQFPFPAADPFMLKTPEGELYLYCTREDGQSFSVRRWKEQAVWEDLGIAFGPKQARWGVDCFWAPECYAIGGRYYLFYSANWRENPQGEEENFRIGVAVSDAPEGPFADLSDTPIFDPGYPVIDANIYEEDGRYYLYYSRCCYKHRIGDLEESWIYGVEMRPDFSGVLSEPVLLLRPEQEWEGRSAASTGRRWNEGSFVFKHEGVYYMTYSGNFFGGPDYAVGYATAKAPLGPYVKAAENPILERGGEVTGTGHSCMVTLDQGGMHIVYHGRTKSTGEARVGFISPAYIDAQGKLKVARA